MSLLRPFSIFLRNIMVRFYPLFSCCASCGEIREPMGRRLCTSLSPGFDIDMVYSGIPASAIAGVSEATRTSMPWLRKLFFIHNGTKDFPDTIPTGSFILTDMDIATANGKAALPAELPAESRLHALPQLSNYYIVCHSAITPGTTTKSPLDFYTPNGIPLIPADALADGIGELLTTADPTTMLQERQEAFLTDGCVAAAAVYAQTRENSSAFLASLADSPAQMPCSPGGYSVLLRQWAFLTGRAIPVPGKTRCPSTEQ